MQLIISSVLYRLDLIVSTLAILGMVLIFCDADFLCEAIVDCFNPGNSWNDLFFCDADFLCDSKSKSFKSSNLQLVDLVQKCHDFESPKL